MMAFRGLGTGVMTVLAVTAVVAAPQRDVNGAPDGRAAAHASAARLDEPPPPREGDVFTPDLVAVIRARVAALALPTHRPSRRVHAIAVGDRLVPSRGTRPPRAVRGVLPPIPGDLDYRLAGNDLVLLDLRTDLVVDAVRHWRER
jgi:hypothetical protein